MGKGFLDSIYTNIESRLNARRRAMLVGITGTEGSGRRTAKAYLESKQLKSIEFNDEALDAIVSRWQEHFVTIIPARPGEISKRPWFVHLNIEAPENIRKTRSGSSNGSTSASFDDRVANIRDAHINLVNNFATIKEFHAALEDLNLLDAERVRPSWDRYFMTIADLASQRSNCMKRRVGCVLVRDKRIVSTGYNGTPRGFTNCSDGGCPRCNSGSKGGSLLSTCLCLHAEENALLEAGRDRITSGTLYCNTCPCLTCSIKIVQSGVKEVVYSQDYSMDTESARVLRLGGVHLRQYKV